MPNLYRYLLLYFVIFVSLYLFRLRQFAVINLEKIKPKSLIKVYAEVASLSKTKNGWQLFKVGPAWIKTNNDEEFFVGQRLKIIGKPQLRVINRFYKQIWLIDPAIYKFESLSKEEQKRFNSKILVFSHLNRLLISFSSFIRLRSQKLFYRTLPEPQAGLLAGIVLGTQEKMEWNFWQALKKTGTLHIIAASGMNVTLVAKVVIDFLVNFINRRKAYFVSVVCILIYCLLAGGSPAVFRAGLMASLALLGLAFGRETSGGWLLFLAAGIMLLVNPLLIFDLGFQLSFAAMVGMIFIKPLLQKCFQSLRLSHRNLLMFMPLAGSQRRSAPYPSEASGSGSHCGNSQNLSTSSLPSTNSYKSNWLTALFSTNLLDTLSAQIATLPILYFTFGQFQAFSFIPNLFVLPLVPTLMMLGFVLLVFGLIWLPLAYPIAWLAWLPLTYFVEMIKWWGKVL